MEMVAKYGLKGYFMYNGKRGNQSGEVVLCSDGKLIGIVRDNDYEQGTPDEKLLLGLRSRENNSLMYIKISPGMQRVGDLQTVMWCLHSDYSLRGSGREESYGGGWVFVSGLPMVDGIRQRLFEGGIPPIENLCNIPVGLMKEYFFQPEVLDACERRSVESKHFGGLTLTPLG